MKILIVDDENVSRKILVQKMELIGKCTAAEDGLKALEIFEKSIEEKKPFDLITLDVSMPKMDGKQLLNYIRKKEKAMGMAKEDQVKIIMVSARMNVSIIKECIKLGCNGYISKPVTKYQLLGSLGRMGFEQPDNLEKEDKRSHNKIVTEIIKRFYKGKIKLPVMPRIVSQVNELIESGDATIDDLAKLLENDIAITARLISIANSALYKGMDHTDNLNAALIRVGLKASCDLISTIAARDLFKSENKKVHTTLEKLWKHSFACGVIGKNLAKQLGMENSDTVLLMGIVHDIGKMLLIKAIVDIFPEENFELDMQVAIHEIHTTFGAALLKRMKFSKEFCQIAEFHHWNDFSNDDDKVLLIINLADYLAGEIGFGFFSFEPEKKIKFHDLEEMKSFKQLKLDLNETKEMAEKAKKEVKLSSVAF